MMNNLTWFRMPLAGMRPITLEAARILPCRVEAGGFSMPLKNVKYDKGGFR